MFGLEDQKKKKGVPFAFDLEKELQNSKKRQEIKQLTEKRLQRLKELLRSGEDKENFDRFGVLLHGYASLLKVTSRLATK